MTIVHLDTIQLFVAAHENKCFDQAGRINKLEQTRDCKEVEILDAWTISMSLSDTVLMNRFCINTQTDSMN